MMMINHQIMIDGKDGDEKLDHLKEMKSKRERLE